MDIPSFSTDFLIIAASGLIVAYGLIVGQGALIREAISTYVGLVLANSFGTQIYNYMQSQANSSLPFNQTAVNLALLAIPVIILQFAHHRPHMRHKSSTIITLILGVMVAMLMVSSILSQLDEATLKSILDSSNLAAQIYNLKMVWIGGVPIAIALSALFRPKDKHH